MYTHPITGEAISFASLGEFKEFLKFLNPTMMREIKKQYEAKNPAYTISGFGEKVEIIKKI